MKTLFGLESDEKVEVTVEEYTVSDAIDAITLESEINESLNEIETLESVVAQAELLATELEVSSELDKVALESDDVTPVVAKMSVASLVAVSDLLGIDSTKYDISLESMENDPKAAVAISLEEKNSTLDKVIAKIKQIVAKIAVAVRKAILKVTLAVTNQAKAAGNLVDDLGNIDSPKDLDESAQNKIKAKVGGICAAKKLDISSGSMQKLAADAVSKVDSVNRLTTVGAAFVGADNVVDKVNAKLTSFFTMSDGKDKEGGKRYRVAVVNNSVKYIVVGKGNKTIGYVSEEVSKDSIDKLSVKSMKPKALASALEKINSNPDYAKNAISDMDKGIKDLEDQLEKTKDKADTEAGKKVFNATKELVQIAPKVGLDEVLDKYKTVGAIIYVAKVVVSNNK